MKGLLATFLPQKSPLESLHGPPSWKPAGKLDVSSVTTVEGGEEACNEMKLPWEDHHLVINCIKNKAELPLDKKVYKPRAGHL